MPLRSLEYRIVKNRQNKYLFIYFLLDVFHEKDSKITHRKILKRLLVNPHVCKNRE
jgi:hypothetical protein